MFFLRNGCCRCFAAVRCIALLNLRLRKRRYLRIALEAKERYFRVWLPRYRAVIFVQNYWRKQRHLRALKHRAEHIIQQFCLKWLSQRRYHRLRAVASQIQVLFAAKQRVNLRGLSTTIFCGLCFHRRP